MYAVSSLTGELMWSVKGGDFVDSSPALMGDKVYFLTGNYSDVSSSPLGNIIALDVSTGIEQWRLSLIKMFIHPLQYQMESCMQVLDLKDMLLMQKQAFLSGTLPIHQVIILNQLPQSLEIESIMVMHLGRSFH